MDLLVLFALSFSLIVSLIFISSNYSQYSRSKKSQLPLPEVVESHFYKPESSSKKSELPLPPGNMGFPLIGESIDFLMGIYQGRIESFVFDRVSKYSSHIFKTSLLGEPVIVMHGPEANKFLFSNENKLVVGWWPKHVQKIMPSTIMTHSFKIRDLLHPFVKQNALHRYLKVMDTMTQRHFNTLWNGHQKVIAYDMVKKLHTLALACQVLLSVGNDEVITELLDPMNDVTKGFASLPLNLPWTQFGRATRASNDLMNQIRTVVRGRRREIMLNGYYSNDGDLLSHMLLCTDKNGKYMTDDEITIRIIEILIVGHESTTVVLVQILRFLADDPHIYELLFQEHMEIAGNKAPDEPLNLDDMHKMKYSWNIARELMRIYPPSPFVFVESISDFNYNGFLVPKGWKIMVNILSLHKDPQYYSEPEELKPLRFQGGEPLPYSYMPFGGGSLLCPGRNYAQIVILIFLHNLLKRFRWQKFNPKEKIIFNPGPNMVDGLPILLHPH